MIKPELKQLYDRCVLINRQIRQNKSLCLVFESCA